MTLATHTSTALKSAAPHHKLLPRRVRFDLTQSPLHWIPHDPEASYIINSIHLLLPAGEFWFCRVYNKVLPQIKDERLRSDVQGFIRQEAIHARSHETALEDYLSAHGVRTAEMLQLASLIFDNLLADRPLGMPDNFMTRRLDGWWLRQRVGIIAAIEHFTCVFGKWVVESEALNAPNIDPAMLDLFRWHGAEEVEHRNVAHELHEAIGGTARERQAWALVVFPALFGLLALGSNQMMRRDPGVAPDSFFRRWWRSGKTGTLPSIESVLAAGLRYFEPDYHPDSEAPLELALAYFAKSPAVQAAMAREPVQGKSVAA
ncbi:MAG: metal-dependent hydrolase [Moraxellaceae bacterium]|nr:metal-dependent hydrolase [Moraxellaceae bacterium]